MEMRRSCFKASSSLSVRSIHIDERVSLRLAELVPVSYIFTATVSVSQYHPVKAVVAYGCLTTLTAALKLR
jgi:hypothetical protein